MHHPLLFELEMAEKIVFFFQKKDKWYFTSRTNAHHLPVAKVASRKKENRRIITEKITANDQFDGIPKRLWRAPMDFSKDFASSGIEVLHTEKKINRL